MTWVWGSSYQPMSPTKLSGIGWYDVSSSWYMHRSYVIYGGPQQRNGWTDVGIGCRRFNFWDAPVTLWNVFYTSGTGFYQINEISPALKQLNTDLGTYRCFCCKRWGWSQDDSGDIRFYACLVFTMIIWKRASCKHTGTPAACLQNTDVVCTDLLMTVVATFWFAIYNCGYGKLQTLEACTNFDCFSRFVDWFKVTYF